MKPYGFLTLKVNNNTEVNNVDLVAVKIVSCAVASPIMRGVTRIFILWEWGYSM